MSISLGFIRSSGFEKIARYYTNKEDFNIKNCNKEVYDSLLSTFSVANNWSNTFGVYELELCNKFVEWYKLYYPEIDSEKRELDQVRVLKASKKLRIDYLEATSIDLKGLLDYAPQIELNSIINKKVLSEFDKRLICYINTIYAWGIIVFNTQKRSKDVYEEIIKKLTKNDKEFVKELLG